MERYEKLDPIGCGSFGKVFLGKRKDTGENVALKFISKVNKLEKEIEGIRQECELQKRLHHRNIIQMLDSFDTHEEIVIVTEQAVMDLSRLVRQHGRLSESCTQKIACDLISALHYLHSERILHRDIKPQNILIGYDRVAKVCDFGFAKAVSIDSYMLTSIKGTPLYMAPEIVDHQPYDYKSDFWSLGCILYELLVGTSPFDTNSLGFLIIKIKKEPIIWPDQIRKEPLSFLQGLLEKNPDQRFTWKELKKHPFIREARINTEDEKEYSFTKDLSQSQEFAKKEERKTLQRDMTKHTKKVVKLKKLPRKEESLKEVLDQLEKGDEISQITIQAEKLNLEQGGSSSSVETYSSLSDNESDGDQTVIENRGSRGYSSEDPSIFPLLVSRRMLDQVLRSSDLFNFFPFEADVKPIESEEWIHFLLVTIKEVVEKPGLLSEKAFLTVVLNPLKNHTSTPGVVENIATLLSLPFAQKEDSLDMLPAVKALYLDSKVLPDLLFACKMTIRRTGLLKKSSAQTNEIAAVLSAEDLEAMDKCLRLVCFLVYSDKEFVVQFCDGICVLKTFGILQLFLKLDRRKSRLATDTLAILCQVARAFPPMIFILEQLFLVERGEEEAEIWRLLSHPNWLIQARMLRILAYLILHSDLTRELIEKQPRKLGLILKTAAAHREEDVRKAGGFALENLRYIGHLKKSEERALKKVCS